MSNNEIARNITFATKAPLSRAKTIARTESHRITQASTYNAQKSAKAKGADVVKQWDSTMDGDTRPTHRRLDGQIRELDEPFEMDGKSAMFPGDFGDPTEDCNCRCVSLQRAKWALDEGELQTLKERAKFFGLDKTEDFQDFKKKYLNAAKTLEKISKNGTIDLGLQFFASKEKQFGKKVGKHAADFGLDPSSAEDRTKFFEIINDIVNNATEVREGEWRTQEGTCIFYIKGNDVVVHNQNDEFVTILEGGVSNKRVKNARRREV